MRSIILFLIVAGSVLVTTSNAVAQIAACRPWCVYYGGGGGGTNCGFSSLEQCRQTAQGSDICMPNGACPSGTRSGYDNSGVGERRRR